jgi:MinD-like ATPase involved in chromosome partitioning or flagellar assembly
MKIISFYSFKGGVGRSLSLVNVAYQLSQKGQRVGLLDLDIEAGGLNQILDVSIDSDRDLLSLLDPGNRDTSEIDSYVQEIKFRKNDPTRVYLLPTITDSKLLEKLRWDESTQHFISDELLPTFSRSYDLDYILIDSRSGLSMFASLALRIADMEILVCRLDSQNRYGIQRMVEICRAIPKPFRVVVSACPAQNRMRHLQKFQEAIKAKVDYVIPYLADLYYEEFIISKRDSRHRLSKEYLALTTDVHEAFSK